ncbi:zinc-dependent metalloprotease [Rhodohalobacter barkolensis]|uniref:Zinc-dependent metalloprotease n=1 Tax=Rhodohalobacter barkolensis TaxID=2053187 RepID=A0A2N0VIA6_9BACT|nr:zinc-dependent metalloprotease [Rhodohalobacter barkolensis]PKD43921.1 zinc-dependent metalloprotease [Rhodohalobacter barkolensis]
MTAQPTIKSLLIYSILILFTGIACQTTGQTTSSESSPSSSQAIPANAEVDEGLFNVYQSGDKIYYAIPEEMLGRDMAIMSRIAKTAEGLGWGGDRLAGQQVVQWDRRGDKILLRGVSYSNTADENQPIYEAVQNSNFPPIIESFDILETRNGSVVIDVSDLYLEDSRIFGLQNRHRQQYTVRGLDRDRSFMEFVKSFPENIEVRTVLTYNAENPPSQQRTGSISIEVNHSMILLPEEPMRPRLYDERVAMISISQTDYGDDAQFSKTKRFVTRFRLEPVDEDAYLRGELVEPKDPIVFYIDPATPEQWRPYFKEGIEEWNVAFEEAGFKNAIRAEMAPVDDPDFSMLDARYSVIRYVSSPVHSANAGPDVIDPRSGETIRAHMNMYHNVQKRLHWWSLSQTGPRNPEVQQPHLSTEEMGQYLQYVVSHELAHALGYPHNQRGNTAYSIEDLRDPEFTNEKGNSSSVVGRTRFNYVAQPEDGDVRVHRSVGEYDVWAIKWAYSYLPQFDTPEDEKELLNEWVLERADDPAMQFGYGYGDFDPTQTTESIGDDWVRASELGMRNLHRVIPNLLDWMGEEGETYDEVRMRYMQMFVHWGRMTERVIAAIGGSREEHKRFGQEGPVYSDIPKEDQKRSMEFLDEHLFATPEWLLDQELLRTFEYVGTVERIRWYQVTGLNALLSPHRMERLVEQHAMNGDDAYGPAEMLDDLRQSIWKELDGSDPVDTYRRNLQRAYLDRMEYLLKEASAEAGNPPADYRPDVGMENLRTDFHIQQSDIRPLVMEQLNELKSDVERNLNSTSDRYTRTHFEYVVKRIDEMI